MEQIAKMKKTERKSINAPKKKKNNDLFKDAVLLRKICAHPSLLEIDESIDETASESGDESMDSESDDDKSESSDDTNTATTSTATKSTTVDVGKTEPHWWEAHFPDDISNMNHSAKIMLLFAILEKCEVVGDKLLVFSQSIPTLDLIEKFLHEKQWKRGVDYFRLDGKVNAKSRQKYCDLFNDDEIKQSRYVKNKL